MGTIIYGYLTFVLLATFSSNVRAKDREYYIASIELDWDYAPHGLNLTGPEEEAPVFLSHGETTIGKVYRKAVYRQYTDASYSQQVAQPDYLGLLGPILRAEVGDRFVIHYKNLASRDYTMHPHGLMYEKNSEGAVYMDGTVGTDKADDSVPPQGNHTYIWEVRDAEAPTGDDPNCLPWVYHSHVFSEKDTNTGLNGILLTCRPGTLTDDGERKDVDEEFGLMFSVMDENLSWLLRYNIHRFTQNPDQVSVEDEAFLESNQMHAVNGYLYNNLPMVSMCRDTRVVWYVLGMGNEVDIHAVVFHGQSFVVHGHRSHAVNVFPANLISVAMTPDSPGRWLVECNVFDHQTAGMYGTFQVDECHTTQDVSNGTLKEYFIAAEEVYWNYAPTGLNLFDGGNLTQPGSHSAKYFENGPARIGSTYKKAKFVGYEDATFTVKKHVAEHQKHLGILGPVIRAEVTERVRVHFRNKAGRPYSVEARGVVFNNSDHGLGSEVEPGETRLYEWTVPESMGPGENDPDCVTRMYYSNTAPKDIYTGLIGPMLICRKNKLQNDKQIGIDREFFLLFMIINENKSWYIEDNIAEFCTGEVDMEDVDFLESNTMHSINGYVYNNMPGLDMCQDDVINWHVFGLGSEADLHTLTFGGSTFTYHGQQGTSMSVFPGSLATVQMNATNAGTFPLICRTLEHFTAGTKMKYQVKPCGNPAPARTERVANRTYYIAAVEQEWDYTPVNNIDPMKNLSLLEDEASAVFVQNGPHAIGSKYRKALYREFTDDTFTTEKARSSDEKHLHMLGPFIKAEVGETIKIVFKNNASRTYAIGTPARFTSRRVAPQQTTELFWHFGKSQGPGPNDPACISTVYFSSGDMVKDIHSGLVGPLVVCRKGTLGPDNRRVDVDREFALLFAVNDENQSWYLDDNINHYCTDPSGVNKEDEDFQESNKMHGINGRLFGNTQGLFMRVGEKVVWYLLGVGDEVDIHTVHFHGTTVTSLTDVSHLTDVIGVFPGTSQVAEMVPHTPAQWLLHCHVNDHMTAGMVTIYTVLPSANSTAAHQILVSHAVARDTSFCLWFSFWIMTLAVL